MTARLLTAIVTFALTFAQATNADHALTVTSADATKGSVSAVGGTYPDGSVVTITATPEAGWTFTRWDGIVPGKRLDNPLVLAVTNDTTVTAVFGKTHYVATNGSDSTTDGTNPATPYLTIEKAYTAADDDDTVSVGAGNFAGSADLTYSKAIVLRGAGMGATSRKNAKNILDNPNAILADMRLTGITSGTMVTVTAGSLLRCDVSGNSSTSTSGTAIRCTVGNIVGCVVTNNTNRDGGRGVALYINGGPTLVENCLIADNTTGYVGYCGGVAVSFNDNSFAKTVTLRHCTIARNSGGEGNAAAGGLIIEGNNSKIFVEGCLIGGNMKFSDESAGSTDDVYLFVGTDSRSVRSFKDTVISRMATPNRPSHFTFENCVTNVAPGYADLIGGDFTVTRRSPAWGLCANGSDAGYFQSPRDGSFDVGCYTLTNAVCGRVDTVLVAKAENAPDPSATTFAWDLDGDGVFEATGATIPASYNEPGLHDVAIRAISGGQTVTRTVANLIYVAPREIFAWPDSPSPAFPYATWATAAHTVNDAVGAAEDGCKVQLTNAFFQVPKPVRICRDIEICGTGKDNNSVKGTAGSQSKRNFIDTGATGTCVQYLPETIIPVCVYRSGVLLHDMAIGPGRATVLGLFENAVVSNCVIRSGQYTGGSGLGVYARAGLVTHCIISNNYNTGKSSGGSVYLAMGGATLRNSLVCFNNHASTSASSPANGTVYAAEGCTVENCTIIGNKATVGGGLYTSGAAIIRNNIVRGNQAAISDNDWHDATGTALFSNNCLPTAHDANDATVTDDPAFIYENDRNTFTFAAGSPCVDKGAPLPWMTATATDFFGNARLQGAAPDIGIFEADMTEATCDISASPASAFGATNIVLTAVIVGGALSGEVAYFWDLNGDGVTDATGMVVTNRFDEGRHSIALTVAVDGETRFAVDRPDLVTVYPRRMYVATANPNCAFPYSTPDTAATNINAALDAAMDGAEIIVLAGTHNAFSDILVNRAITLHAAPGLSARPTLKRRSSGGSTTMFVTVSHADARVEGLVIDDNFINPGALRITASGGTVCDCVVSNGSYTTGAGMGISMDGGLFDRGVVVASISSDGGKGLAAFLQGDAVVRNALIHRNVIRNGSKQGVVYITGNARLENCTVVSNSCGAIPVVYAAGTGGGAAVVNCIIRDNYFKSEPETAYPGGTSWYLEASAGALAWSNNLATAALREGDGTILGDPLFRNPAKVDYRLGRKSPARDKGVWRDWMDGSLDFLGNPRVRGVRPDIGCAEVVGQDPLLLFAQ